MFVDFNNVFKSKPMTENKIPDIVVAQLSKTLPRGIKYVAGDNGNVTITGDDGKFTLGGFTPIIPESFKAVLGENYTQKDVMLLSYNSQVPMRIVPDRKGYIMLNGSEIPIDKMCYNIFDGSHVEEDSLVMLPEKFQDTLVLEFSTSDGKYVKKLNFTRNPLLSINEMLFISDSEYPFSVEMHISGEEQVKINVSLKLNLAKNIREMVESIYLYNAVIDNSILIEQEPLRLNHGDITAKKYDVKSAAFWEKVLKVEERLGLTFPVPEGDTDFQTICDIEMLYQNLICGKPIRQNYGLASVTGEYNMKNNFMMNDGLDKELYFQYTCDMSLEIFGTKIKLPALMGLFNSKFERFEKTRNGKVKLYLKDISPDAPAYTSVICFDNENRLQQFLSEHDNIANVMVGAKTVNEYIDF